MKQQLPESEIRLRASKIKLILTDVDGTLTDTGVYYSARGEELKRFSIRDGMGIEMLRERGIETAMITREISACVESRSKKLKLPYLYMGIWDKREFLPTLLTEVGLSASEIGYFGDDVNDFEIMETLQPFGLIGCPNDAMPAISQIVHYKAAVAAGHGAFRDFAEWIMKYHSTQIR